MTAAQMAEEIALFAALLHIAEDDARLVFQDIAVEAAVGGAGGSLYDQRLAIGIAAFRGSYYRHGSVMVAQLDASDAIQAFH